FYGLEELVVVAEGPDLDESKAFIQHLAEHLQQDPVHIKEIFYRVDLSSLHGKKLLLLSPDELQILRKQLETHQEALRKVLTSPSLNTLFVEINREVNSAMAVQFIQGFLGLQTAEDTQDHVPFSLSFLQSLLEQMKSALTSSRVPYQSPWATLFGHDILSDDSFLVSGDHRLVFLLVEPQVYGDSFTARRESISAVRQQIAALRQEFPQVQVGVTGEKALENDEMVTAQANSSLATLVSLIGVSFLYFVFFRSVWRTLLVLTTILVGLSWALGMVTLTVGHLSLISIFVAPILIGLADDRIIYFLSCYAEERDHGQSVLDALAATVTHAAPGIVAAACTNALAFYAMILADFRGIQELGFITGTGILLSCIVTLTFLPALLALTDGKIPWLHSTPQSMRLAALGMRWGIQLQRLHRPVLFFAGSVSFLCVLTLPSLAFDYNLLHLQARETESVSWEQRVFQHAGRSSWFALATSPSLADATQKAIRFEALPLVEKVESIRPFIPEGQEERMLLVRNLDPFVPELSTTSANSVPVRVERLKNSLENLQFKLQRSREDDGEAQNNPAAQDLAKVQMTLAEVLELLRARPLSQVGLALDSFQDKLFQDFADTWALLRDNLHPSGPLTLADIPPQLRNRFVSADQTQFLLQIYPRQDIWEWKPLSEFVTQLRQVDPTVTGSPIIGYESIRTITHGYVTAGLYATAAILMVVLLTVGRLRLSGLVMLPVVLGLLWT
ncbi:MAG: MMPL family transporter, partial [Terriglobia bacterium]